MNGLGIEVKAAALFIALSVIPLSAAGYLLTEQSMNELNDKSIEGLTDVVRGKAMLYSEELINFKEDAEALSEYISGTWNRSCGGVANYSYIWISPNGTGYDVYADEMKNFNCIMNGFELAVGHTSKVELAYFGTESGLVFFNKPVVPIIEQLKPFDHRERPWYEIAKEENETIWTPVYVDANTKELVTTVAAPVYINNKFAGVVGLDLLLETIQQDILDLKFADSGYAILVDNSGNIIVHPDYTAGDKKWNDTFTEENILGMGSDLEKAGKEMIAGKENAKELILNGKEYYVAYSPIHGINGSIAFFVEKEKITGAIEQLREKMYIGIIILTGAMAILGLFLSRSLTEPIEKLTRGAEEVAKGNLDYRIETKSKDEIGMLTDSFNKMVEELKNSRKKLEESERKYRDLFENSRDMVYISSKDGRFIDVNKAGEELLGYSRDELLKMNGADLYANREDRERFMREIAEKGFVKDYEVKYKRKDGKVITCLETASAKKDEEGNIIGYQGLVRDITKLKEAERRVELYNSLMRHDITNNSQLAHGYLEILMDTEMTDEQKRFADKAMKTLEKSRDLLQRVRAINKAKEKHKLRKFDIDDIIKKSIETYEHQAEDRGIKIEYEGKNVDVIADELAENVFSNIIGNAIIHSGCDKINIAVDEDENYCKVTISDNGRGIPEDIKKSVFEWGTKSKESEGSGLGLYLVKTIVESYGGRIELKDGKGEGTTFEIYLKKWGKSEGKQEDEN